MDFKNVGIPKRKECPLYDYDDGGEEECRVWNECHDEWTAWLAGRVNVERVRKIIDLYNSDKIDGSKMTWEEYRNQFAEAIVKDILGEE